jgi:hypothetical protein
MVKCEKCDREFKTAHAMKIHRFQAHGGRKSSKGTRRYNKKRGVELSFCPSCGMNIRMLAQALHAIKDLR